MCCVEQSSRTGASLSVRLVDFSSKTGNFPSGVVTRSIHNNTMDTLVIRAVL